MPNKCPKTGKTCDLETQVRKDQQVLNQLVRSQDHDRQLIAYEIHDSLIQLATSVVMHLEGAINCTMEGEAEAGYKMALGMSREVVGEARRLISGLRSPALDEHGVVVAIEQLTKSAGLPVTFKHDVHFERLEPSLENSMYRVVQECITNIVKHSGSNRAIVEISQENHRVAITVRDWGCGFDTESVSEKGYGLGGIRERTRLFGGKAEITSVVGKGTTVIAEFDLNGIWEKK